MAELADPAPAPPKTRKHWLPRPRFSLRTLVIGCLLVASVRLLLLHWAAWVRVWSAPAFTSAVWSFTIFPDGRQVAIGNPGGRVRIIDIATGNTAAELGNSDEVVDFASISDDGKRIATAASTTIDWPVRVFDLQSGKELSSFLMHSSWVRTAVLSHDGLRVLTASLDGTACLLDVAQPERIHYFLKENEIASASFSPDERFAITCGDKSDFVVWDLETMQQKCVMPGAEHGTWKVVYAHNSQALATTTYGPEPRVWDAQTFKQRCILQGHSAITFAASFSPDNNEIVTASADGTVRIWDAQSGKQRLSIEAHLKAANSAVFCPDGSTIATGGSDGVVRIWDSKTGSLLKTLLGGRYVEHAEYTPDGKWLVVSDDDVVCVWRRQHPEYWWGVAWLPEFWLTVMFAGALGWSVWRERRMLRKKTEAE